MTVSATYTPVQLEADGILTDFEFGFKIFSSADLFVALIDRITLAATTQVLGIDFTVTVDTITPGGTVSFLSAPADTYNVYIARDMDITQDADIPAGGLFREVQIENALDRAIMLLQIQREMLDRALLQNPYASIAEIIFPLASANKTIGWNAAGDGLENKDAIDASYITACEVAQTAAEVAETAAEAAQTAAEFAMGETIIAAAKVPDPGADDAYKISQVKSDHSGYELTAGNAANRPVILNGFGKLPALDGSLLTNIPSPTYIKISDVKAQNTAGGTATSGAWYVRDINTEDNDTGGHCAIAANQITLAAGTYEVEIIAPFNYCNVAQLRLYNVTDAAVTILGQTITCNSTAGNNVAHIKGRFTIAAQKTFEVQYQVQTTYVDIGLGVAGNWGSEVYTIAEFRKVA